MRPVVQKALARVANDVVNQGALTWEQFCKRLEDFAWELGEPPWIAVFSPDAGKMLTGKDNTQLLEQLLRVHLAPPSLQEIKRARKQFKDIRGYAYPVSQDDLQHNLVSSDAT